MHAIHCHRGALISWTIQTVDALLRSFRTLITIIKNEANAHTARETTPIAM